MPATTRTEVFAFENNLNKAFRDWFDDNSIELFDRSVLKDPASAYISVKTEIGEATGHYTPLGSGFVYDHYNFTVTFLVKSPRFEPEHPEADDIDSLHYLLIANVRRWMSKLEAGSDPQPNIDDYLSLYEINTLRPSGTVMSIDGESDETELTYTGQFSIIPSAWPI